MLGLALLARPMPGLDRLGGRPADAASALHDRVPVGDEPGLIDVVERQPERRPVALDHDLMILDALQDPLEVAALARRQVERRRELDLGLAAGEAPEVLGGAQRAIDARRADLEVKRLRDRVPVSYTHLRAHETPEHLVCRL